MLIKKEILIKTSKIFFSGIHAFGKSWLIDLCNEKLPCKLWKQISDKTNFAAKFFNYNPRENFIRKNLDKQKFWERRFRRRIKIKWHYLRVSTLKYTKFCW